MRYLKYFWNLSIIALACYLLFGWLQTLVALVRFEDSARGASIRERGPIPALQFADWQDLILVSFLPSLTLLLLTTWFWWRCPGLMRLVLVVILIYGFGTDWMIQSGVETRLARFEDARARSLMKTKLFGIVSFPLIVFGIGYPELFKRIGLASKKWFLRPLPGHKDVKGKFSFDIWPMRTFLTVIAIAGLGSALIWPSYSKRQQLTNIAEERHHLRSRLGAAWEAFVSTYEKDGIDALAELCVPPFGRGQSRSILIEQMKSVASDSHALVPDYAVVTPIISGPGTDDPYRLEAVIYPRSIAGAGWRFIYEDGRWLYTGEREHEEYEE